MTTPERKTTSAPTKKHLARQQREQRQTRFIVIGTLVVLAAVILLVGYGVLDQQVLRFKRSVAVVNGERISAEEFRAYTKYYRSQLIQQAEQTYQFASMFGSDQAMMENFATQLQSIASELTPVTAAESSLNVMVDNALVVQEAKKQGITVTEAEIESRMQELLGYYADGTPTPTATRPPLATSTLSPLQESMLQPTATEAPATETPAGTPEVDGTAAPTEPAATEPVTTEAVATEAPAETTEPTLEPTASGPTPTEAPTLTPTPFTFEGYQNLYATVVTNYETAYEIDAETLRYTVEMQLYREKLSEAVIGEVPCEEERVWAQHILVADLPTAETVKQKLDDGEDWYALVSEYSTDTGSKDTGGDLSWFPRTGAMVEEFSAAAFELEVGEISQPVQSQFGYHIIRVLGHENQPLTPTECNQLEEQKFSEWIQTAREGAQVELLPHWETIYPLQPSLPEDIQLAIQSLMSAGTEQQPLPVIPTP